MLCSFSLSSNCDGGFDLALDLKLRNLLLDGFNSSILLLPHGPTQGMIGYWEISLKDLPAYLLTIIK
jgi:hypothetical protein